MSAAPPTPLPDDDLLAAELAFGLADKSELAEASTRVEREPAFAAAHDLWLLRAVAIAGCREEAPGEAVWAAIRARLQANDPAAGAQARAQLRRWRLATFATAAAATLIALLGWTASHRPRPAAVVAVSLPAPVERPLVATLTDADRRATVAISFVPGSDRLAVMPNGVRPGGRATELWVIPAGGQPRAIGVIPAFRPSWTAVPATQLHAIVPGATLAISLEPAGGSTTGRPTGPVILTGGVVAVG